MTAHDITGLAGGLGLFLLGLWLVSYGIKNAAGNRMKDALTRMTGSPAGGILTGIWLAPLVQSSGTVTAMLMGLAGAGLIPLFNALWIVVGANIGSTAVTWLIALVGLKLSLQNAALPAIALGMLIKSLSRNPRLTYLGIAIAGFGAIFVGIDLLKNEMAGAAESLSFLSAQDSVLKMLFHASAGGLLIGAVAQSSAPGTALALTGAATGLLSPEAAVLAVLWTHLGSTSIVLLPSIGAEPRERRVALVHAGFNAIMAITGTAVIASLIPASSMLISMLPALQHGPATSVAMCQTLVALACAAAMLPFGTSITRYLNGRFKTENEHISRPKHLSVDPAAEPWLGTEALEREIGRMSKYSLGLLHAALSGAASTAAAKARGSAIEELGAGIDEYAARLAHPDVPDDVRRRLPGFFRAAQHYERIAAISSSLPSLTPQTRASAGRDYGDLYGRFRETIREVLSFCSYRDSTWTPKEAQRSMKMLESIYAKLKASLLDAGSQGAISPTDMESLLHEARSFRRAASVALKARRKLAETQIPQ